MLGVFGDERDLLLSGGDDIEVIFDARTFFNVADAAPVANPYDKWDVADTLPNWSVTSGELVPSAGTTSTGNPAIYHSGGLSRIPSRFFKTRVKRVSALGANANSPMLGFSNAANFNNIATVYGFLFSSAANFNSYAANSAFGFINLIANASDVYYDFATIARSVGMFQIIGSKLAFIAQRGNEAALYGGVTGVSASRNPPGVRYLARGRLGGPWASDYGIANYAFIGLVSGTPTFSHQANCLATFTLDSLPSTNLDINFRKQDASNYWQLRVTSAGAFQLNKIVAGTPTTMGSIATCQAADHLQLIADGSDMILHRQRGTGTGDASSAQVTDSAFASSASGDVALGGGAMSNLAFWPRVLTGSALAWVNAA